jgi:hypothetical protein
MLAFAMLAPAVVRVRVAAQSMDFTFGDAHLNA